MFGLFKTCIKVLLLKIHKTPEPTAFRKEIYIKAIKLGHDKSLETKNLRFLSPCIVDIRVHIKQMKNQSALKMTKI